MLKRLIKCYKTPLLGLLVKQKLTIFFNVPASVCWPVDLFVCKTLKQKNWMHLNILKSRKNSFNFGALREGDLVCLFH